MTFGESCHFWFSTWVTHTLGPWFNPLFHLGTATMILKASFLPCWKCPHTIPLRWHQNTKICFTKILTPFIFVLKSLQTQTICYLFYKNPKFFHICAEKSSEANVQNNQRIKQCIKYISHDSCPVQHYLVVFPIQVHIHLGLRRCSHLKRYFTLKM